VEGFDELQAETSRAIAMTGSANFFMGHLDAAGDFDLFSLCETLVRPNLLHPSQRRYHEIVAALGDRGLILRRLEVIPNQESSALHQSRMVNNSYLKRLVLYRREEHPTCSSLFSSKQARQDKSLEKGDISPEGRINSFPLLTYLRF